MMVRRGRPPKNRNPVAEEGALKTIEPGKELGLHEVLVEEDMPIRMLALEGRVQDLKGNGQLPLDLTAATQVEATPGWGNRTDSSKRVVEHQGKGDAGFRRKEFVVDRKVDALGTVTEVNQQNARIAPWIGKQIGEERWVVVRGGAEGPLLQKDKIVEELSSAFRFQVLQNDVGEGTEKMNADGGVINKNRQSVGAAESKEKERPRILGAHDHRDMEFCCVLCGLEDETHEHLFCCCAFSRAILKGVLQHFKLRPRLFTWGYLKEWVTKVGRGKSPRAGEIRKAFATSLYEIWVERNSQVFQGNPAGPDVIIRKVLSYVAL
ncbi:hypothetical protein Dimus_010193 [Dionaea muscipula]